MQKRILQQKGQWHGALMFSLICVWINGWVNNGEAGDLRRHRAHYDVTVMCVFAAGHNQIWTRCVNTLTPRQNGRHFPDDTFKGIFLNESVEFSSKFIPQCSSDDTTSIGSDNGLAPNRRQAIIWPNGCPLYWPIYASLGLKVLR